MCFTACFSKISSDEAIGGGPKGRFLSLKKLIAIVLFLIVSYAFVYWGIPFAYGYKLSVRALQARLWNKKW